jgi:hypothetical protein
MVGPLAAPALAWLALLKFLAFSSLDAGVSQKLAFPLRLKKHHSLLK